MNTYRNSSFSRMKVLALAALFAGCGVASAKPTINIGARVFLDYVMFQGSDYNKFGGTGSTNDDSSLRGARFPSGANLNEANIWLYGELANDFDYWLQIDMMYRTPHTEYHPEDALSGNNTTEGNISAANSSTSGTLTGAYSTRTRVLVEKAWLRYTYGDFQFKFGQIYVPFSMSWTTDKSHQLFMEKPNLTRLLDRRHFGINMYTFGDMWTLNASAVAKEMHAGAVATGNYTNSTSSEEFLMNDTYSAMARITVVPTNTKTKTMHFGLNAKYQELHAKNRFGNTLGQPASAGNFARRVKSWTAGTELFSRQSTRHILSTEAVGAAGRRARQAHPVKHFDIIGVELAGKWEAFHAQAELMRMKVDYDTAANKAYKAFYMQGGWFWTGESRVYDMKSGTFKNPVPDSKCGAWEIVARYSHLDLDNDDSFVTTGDAAARTGYEGTGKVTTYGFGLNWIINPNVSFKANYMFSKFNFRGCGDRDVKGIGLRAQLDL